MNDTFLSRNPVWNEADFIGRSAEIAWVIDKLNRAAPQNCNLVGAGKTRSVVEKGVSRLREKIEADPKRPRYLLSAWGEGYLLRSRWSVVGKR